MRLSPSSTARRRTRRHSSGSAGSPQIPSPVRRMEPKPRRRTVGPSPIRKVPVASSVSGSAVRGTSPVYPGAGMMNARLLAGLLVMPAELEAHRRHDLAGVVALAARLEALKQRVGEDVGGDA